MTQRTKPRYHHGSLESALVDEAVHQIRERGADQVSLRGLAQTIGVSPSAAYQHFPDKAALLCSRLRRRRHASSPGGCEPRWTPSTAGRGAGAIGRFLASGARLRRVRRRRAPPLPAHVRRQRRQGRPFTHPTSYLDARMGADGNDPYDILLARFAELAERGLLRLALEDERGSRRPRLEPRARLRLARHRGASARRGRRAAVLDLFGRLVLTDEAFARFRAERRGRGRRLRDEPARRRRRRRRRGPGRPGRHRGTRRRRAAA